MRETLKQLTPEGVSATFPTVGAISPSLMGDLDDIVSVTSTVSAI